MTLVDLLLWIVFIIGPLVFLAWVVVVLVSPARRRSHASMVKDAERRAAAKRAEVDRVLGDR